MSETHMKSRAPEFYGFVALSSTSFLFVVYVLWSLLPDEWIVRMGIEWYPSREWSLLLPSWTIVLVLLTYFSYMSLTIWGTPEFGEVKSLVDSRAQYPLQAERNEYDQRALFASYARYSVLIEGDGQGENAIDSSELYDIPIELVNKVAYA